MMRIGGFIGAFIVGGVMTISPALAGSNVAYCQALAPATLKAASGMSDMAAAVRKMDVEAAAARFTGAERASLERVEAARKKLVSSLDAYIAALSASAIVLQACADQD